MNRRQRKQKRKKEDELELEVGGVMSSKPTKKRKKLDKLEDWGEELEDEAIGIQRWLKEKDVMVQEKVQSGGIPGGDMVDVSGARRNGVKRKAEEEKETKIKKKKMTKKMLLEKAAAESKKVTDCFKVIQREEVMMEVEPVAVPEPTLAGNPNVS